MMIGQFQSTSRRRVRAGVAMAVTAGGLLSAACSASSSTPSAAPPASPAPPPGATVKHAHPLRGIIGAENGNSWTVTTARGVAYTVNITPTTAFGTKTAPATPQSFPVGNTVVVMGKRTGTTIDATRIATAPPIPAPATPAPASPSTSPSATG